MELKYIEIFCAVVELKSFSKAAHALGLTQPTISVHIKALEDEFSTKLLDRLGRTVLPTRNGEILYRYAKEIVNLKENARRAMESVSSSVSGKLTVGASTIPGEFILPNLLARFVGAYPDVFPTLIIGDSNFIHGSVLRSEVDVGIIGSSVKDKNILTRKFLDDELILVSRPDYRPASLEMDELRKAPLLIREIGSGSRASIEETMKKSGRSLEDFNIVAEMGSSQALIQAVKSGMGLAFISRLSVEADLKQKSLKTVKLKGIRITRGFHIISHRLRFHSHICRTFIDFVTGSQ
jgi:DNA-binding transcriptional LysR family regulator